ncbi:HAMP domain-containing histidine kinase [Bacillus sp. WMMC1349]|uniref:sensor histidine kinase n=1 Tax=Bacillus sp. WMMC1349 TaxID=2736254 RepID=UPI00155394A1|nr:HAMP domain-containing sensor histidine kinase [Bacillus sp. WMMC1349]NPC91430.1 HAMP domain-containing histidine kinase [Bacillus sp. WMMC1349]
MMYIILILCCIIISLIIDKINMNLKIKQLTKNVEFVMDQELFSFVQVKSSHVYLQDLAITINQFINKYRHLTKVVSEMDEERRDLIENISHDIRTPLTSIMGFLEVMMNEHNDLSHEEKQKYLSIVYEKSRKLGMISRDFFDFSKIESNVQPLSVDKIHLPNFIENTILEFYYKFEKNGIELDYSSPKTDIIVLANKLSLERIINNLLNNALLYGASGKVIGINIKELEDNVMIEIWDKGEGISESDLPHIFKRSYQADSSRNNGGSGLGLTICKELVERQGGQMKVSSVPFEKTAFTFSIPKVSKGEV